MLYFNIAIKSILARRRQYKSLYAVCAVGVCIMLSALMITDGMIRSMKEKARQYYGGDIQLMGGKEVDNRGDDIEANAKLLKDAINDDRIQIFKRYTYDGRKASYYFEGMSVRQRALVGVDFEDEKELFKKFTFIDGSAESNGRKDCVLLSEALAKKLGCHAGDSVTFYIETVDGFTNTLELVLIGVFQDASIFGMYTSYMSIEALIEARNEPELIVNRFSAYDPEHEISLIQMKAVHSALSKKVNIVPFGMDKQIFYEKIYSPDRTEDVYILVPLDQNVSDLRLLIQALQLIVFAIVCLLVIIISVGISSTYRVIVIKRNVESGTLRAIGMKTAGIMKLFITEAFVLLVTGCVTGFISALIIVNIASVFNLSFISGFDMFLTSGTLNPYVNLPKILGLVTIIIVTTLGSVLFTLRKLVHVSPVEAIAATT